MDTDALVPAAAEAPCMTNSGGKHCTEMLSLVSARTSDAGLVRHATERVHSWCDREARAARVQLEAAEREVNCARDRLAQAESKNYDLGNLVYKALRWCCRGAGDRVEFLAVEVWLIRYDYLHIGTVCALLWLMPGYTALIRD